MPYIAQQDTRKLLDRNLTDIQPFINTDGTLNYAITRLLDNYVLQRGGLSYAVINEVMGVMTCAANEFYRRVAVPYEDAKLAANGDVYVALHKEEAQRAD